MRKDKNNYKKGGKRLYHEEHRDSARSSQVHWLLREVLGVTHRGFSEIS
jgi:hypothetical protein